MKYFVICLFSVLTLASCSTAPATEADMLDSTAVDSVVVDSVDSVVMVPDSIVLDSVK